ncbi:hypothetical protein MTO96_017103 [Rhipicephalus appendiculatus]
MQRAMTLEEINTAIPERTPETCDAYLCSKAIRIGCLLTGIASSSKSVCGNLWHKHWMVTFDYGGNELLVCEATKDRKGGTRRALVLGGEDSRPQRLHRHLGEHTLPKARIEDVVKEMRYMGRYHATKNNCQKWVMELVRRLEIEAPRDQLDAETVVNTAKPPIITTIVGTVLLAGAVGIAKCAFGPPLADRNTTIRGPRTLEACHVYLCSQPIPYGSLLAGFASSSQCRCGNLWHKHWVVIFDFGGQEVLVCEATKDGTGKLKGCASWEEKTYVHNNAYSYEASTARTKIMWRLHCSAINFGASSRHLGEHTLPKATVENVVKEIRYLGPYNLTTNNCQTWAQMLLGLLEIRVPQDVPDAQTVYEKAKPSIFAALSSIVVIRRWRDCGCHV